MAQSEFNPFEKIAKFNHKNYKTIAFFAFISVILLIPLAISAFGNTSSATTSFLSGDLESIEVNHLLDEQFPNRSESSMIIILEKENGDSILLNDSLAEMLEISEALHNNSKIGDKIEVSSIASIEAGAQQAYNEGLNRAKNLVSENLVDPLSTLADNISYFKSIYRNISDLAITIEQMGAFVDIYATLFFDFTRSVFYLSEITQAYESFFYYSDYAAIAPYWFNNSENMPLNKLLTLQGYVGTFQNITQIRASPQFADTFLNGFTFNFLNLSIASFSQLSESEYVASPLYQLLTSLKQSWDNAFNNFTMTNPLGLSGNLTAVNPINAQISQGIVLSNIIDIAQEAFPEFLGSLTSLFSQGDFKEESINFESLNPQAMLSMNINDTVIQGLHEFPIGYFTTWVDIARSIFYLGNFTDAYVSNSPFNPFHNITISSIWANSSFGLWDFNSDLFLGAYAASNITVPVINLKLGNITFLQAFGSIYGNANDSDATINSLVFEFLNQSILSQYLFLNAGDATNYTKSIEYMSLLNFNSSWTQFFNLFFTIDPVFDDLILPPNIGPLNNPGNSIEFSQLALINRLNSLLNITFVDYLATSFETLASSTTSSSSPTTPGPLYGFSITNQPQLEQYTLILASSLFSDFDISGLNSSQITLILSTNLVPIGVEYRYNSSIPEPVLKSNVLLLINSILLDAGSIQSLTDFFGEEGSEFNSPLFEAYIDVITDAINISLVISQVYDTTVQNSNIDISEIAVNASDRATIELRKLITFPTLENNLGQSSDAFKPILEGFVGHDNKTTLIFVTFPGISNEEELNGYVEVVRGEMESILDGGSFTAWVTGGIAIGHDTDISLERDIETVDRVTIVLVLVLLTIVFLSVVAPAVPLAGIGMAIMSALGTIYVLSEVIDIGIPSIMISLLTVTMLGAGVDYCLFVMWRYKEERQRGVNKYSAVKESVIHAGESVASSGSTVMIGFGSLLLSSFSLLNQMGLGPMIGIGFSLIAALTIIPIGLYLLGDRLFWPRKFRKDYLKKLEASGYDHAEIRQNPSDVRPIKAKNTNNKEPILRKMAKFTVKHPLIIIGFFVIISIPFLYQVSRIEVSYDSVDFLPQNVEAVDGLEHLQGKFSLGTIFPIQVVLHFEDPISDNATSTFYNQEKLDLIDQFAVDLLNEFGETSDGRIWIEKITTITRPYGSPINRTESLDDISIAQMKQFIGPTSNNTIIVNLEVGEEIEPIGVDALGLVGEIRNWRGNYDGFGSENVRILVGGSVSQFYEISSIISHETPFLIAAVMIGIFIVLFFITGSLFTPIRLELTILLSIFMALGAVQFYFVDIEGSGIPWMIPIMLFVLIFGLGMDYDIFIVTRMREEVARRGATDEEAIITALEKTGTIITAAGVIMAASLGSLFLASSNILRIMGFAFFFAIILDATLIRQLLVPAMMVLAKRANWWNPIKALQRVPDDNERARLRQIHRERIESDLVFNDLDDDELSHYEKDFKKDVKVIQNQREIMIEMIQNYWKANKRQQLQMVTRLDHVKTVIHNVESKYDEYRVEIRDALDIWVEDNTKAIIEVKSLINQLSDALGIENDVSRTSARTI